MKLKDVKKDIDEFFDNMSEETLKRLQKEHDLMIQKNIKHKNKKE